MLSTSAGHEVVGVADSLDTALAMAKTFTPEAALVDINLRDGFTGVKISQAIAGAVCVGFITGNAEQIPADFAGAVAVLEKPFTQAGVEEMLGILQKACEGDDAPTPPLRHARLAT